MLLGVPVMLGALLVPSMATGATGSPSAYEVVAGPWAPLVHDTKTNASCLPSDFMVGFKIYGSSIGGSTESSIRCAYTAHKINTTRALKGALHKSPLFSDKTLRWECPENTAMYQRLHFNNWPGQVQFRCAELIAYNKGLTIGDGTKKLTFSDSYWSDWVYSKGEFSCPAGQLLGGVESSMNVTHRFQCRVLA